MALNFGQTFLNPPLFEPERGDRQVLFGAGNRVILGSVIEGKAGGNVTLAAATTTFGTNSLDVVFEKGELQESDIVLVFFYTRNMGGQQIDMRMDTVNTSNDQTGSTIELCTSGEDAIATFESFQPLTTNDNIVTWVLARNNTATTGVGTLVGKDTNDANIFITNFTLRYTFKYLSSASADTLIAFNVEIHRAA